MASASEITLHDRFEKLCLDGRQAALEIEAQSQSWRRKNGLYMHSMKAGEVPGRVRREIYHANARERVGFVPIVEIETIETDDQVNPQGIKVMHKGSPVYWLFEALNSEGQEPGTDKRQVGVILRKSEALFPREKRHVGEILHDADDCPADLTEFDRLTIEFVEEGIRRRIDSVNKVLHDKMSFATAFDNIAV